MSKEAEITFMQTRIIRLASEEWHLNVVYENEYVVMEMGL